MLVQRISLCYDGRRQTVPDTEKNPAEIVTASLASARGICYDADRGRTGPDGTSGAGAGNKLQNETK